MFEMSSFMTRLMLRQLNDASGNPTDEGVISISRLHQFMRPIFFRKKTQEGVEIRLEWLGYYEVSTGQDIFAVEAELREKVLKHFLDDSKQYSLHRNL
jgi:hypothetical protein